MGGEVKCMGHPPWLGYLGAMNGFMNAEENGNYRGIIGSAASFVTGNNIAGMIDDTDGGSSGGIWDEHQARLPDRGLTNNLLGALGFPGGQGCDFGPCYGSPGGEFTKGTDTLRASTALGPYVSVLDLWDAYKAAIDWGSRHAEAIGCLLDPEDATAIRELGRGQQDPAPSDQGDDGKKQPIPEGAGGAYAAVYGINYVKAVQDCRHSW
jgi:hypothetical protein